MKDLDIIEYFTDYAMDDNEARSYVYINKQTGKTVACISIACSVIMTEVNNAISEYYPAVLIDKFIVDKNYRHLQYMKEDDTSTLSSMIFMDFLEYIEEISVNIIGAKYVVLYSVEEAHTFYHKKCDMNNFEDYMKRTDNPDTNDCIPMYCFI